LPRLSIKRRVYMHNVHRRRSFQSRNKRNNLCMRNAERTYQKRNEFRENIVCGDEVTFLLPSTTVYSCRTVVI
jgi:hypothetical protein